MLLQEHYSVQLGQMVVFSTNKVECSPRINYLSSITFLSDEGKRREEKRKLL